MDDFYSEMRDFLDFQEPIEEGTTLKTSSWSLNSGSSIFVESLAPINLHKWPGYTTGSALSSDMPDLVDKLKTPFVNLRVAKEYLEPSKSDV